VLVRESVKVLHRPRLTGVNLTLPREFSNMYLSTQ
jgi:hypothetical protein